MSVPAAPVRPGLPAVDPTVLDVVDGLARFDGDVAFYRELLAAMLEEASAGAAALPNLEPAAQVRRAHTLRGLAGNVGARALQASATRLEEALRAEPRPANVDELVEALERARLATLAAVRDLLDASHAPEEALAGAAAPPPPDAIRRLRVALDRGELAALDELAAARDGYRTLLGPNFESFERSIERFDFPVALALLPPD